ncbi:hypothetical protein JCM19237_305 [Photobacterium aphoticum]|uniref:Uncharacterized protein n=1 Tax=Photobacterium aphoticum TaxID=754436 RepID=A0A090QXJ8_9GAMM|nr:hypothetical protein JCM19237_305 [Photobacterium aphoticum]
MLQSVAWQKIIGKQMELAANRVSFGDDRKYSHVLTKQEAKAAAKNRSTKIDPEKAKAAFRNYQRSQKAFDKKLKQNQKEIDRVRKQANRIRKQSNTIKKQQQTIDQMRDMLKMSFAMFSDGIKAAGGTRDQAIKQFAQKMNMSESKLKGVLK